MPLRRASAEFHESSEGLAAAADAYSTIDSATVPDTWSTPTAAASTTGGERHGAPDPRAKLRRHRAHPRRPTEISGPRRARPQSPLPRGQVNPLLLPFSAGFRFGVALRHAALPDAAGSKSTAWRGPW